jgi:hypothetical protein
MSDAIARWWDAFRKEATRIDAHFRMGDEFDVPEWMHEYLGAIHPDLMWEFGPAIRTEGHRLVITPESRRELRPLVREILSRAPSLSGWEFYEYRLAEEFEQAAATVKGRTGGDLDGLRFRAQPGTYNCIDLSFDVSSLDEGKDHRLEVAFVAAECLLGEEFLDRWIGVIDVGADSAAEVPRLDISELRDNVDQLISQIQANLADTPWHTVDLESGARWSVLEFKPEEAEDYPEQRDLVVGVTVIPAMWQNAYSETSFDSARFSKCGERFCYLKIDGTFGLEMTPYADRGEIEDAINDICGPANWGARSVAARGCDTVTSNWH